MRSPAATGSIPTATPVYSIGSRAETMADAFSFELQHIDGAARAGLIHTPHGMARKPTFMAVGTQGALKAVHWHEVREAGADIVLGNTYHLMLRPGPERIAALGGAAPLPTSPAPAP